MYIKKMVGTKCYLSPIDLADAEKYAQWLNDAAVTDTLILATNVISVEAERELLQKLMKEHAYAIVDMQTNELIGNVGLHNIDHVHQTAEVGIFIGNKNYWNQGYGQEALSLLVDFAYRTLNIASIMLQVYSFNERGLHCYENIGFKKIGEWRNAITRNRKKYNLIFMDILPEEFYARWRQA